MINEQHAVGAIKRKPRRESLTYWRLMRSIDAAPGKTNYGPMILPQHEAAIESNLPDKKIQKMKLKLHSNIQKYQ